MSEETYNAWPEDFPETTCLVPYNELRHSTDPEIRELYDRAKNHEDREAAVLLINRLVSDEAIEKIKAMAARHPDAVIVPVHAVEGAGKNAIPAVLAAFIGEAGNLEVSANIVQASIVRNTGQNSWHRFAYRAVFEGGVTAGRDHILVDDVVSTGGTFSEFRRFIEEYGGKVVDTIAMANGARSMDATLAVTPGHILELERKYGIESIQQFLKEENLYGGNHKALTDPEARTLLGAASLDEARNQIAAAKRERNSRIRPKVVPGTSPDPENLTTANTGLSNSPAQQARKSYAENLNTLKEAYTGALSRYGIRSDEAREAYKAYADYGMVQRFDPRGVREGRYDSNPERAALLIKTIQTRLTREQEQREKLIPDTAPVQPASHEAGQHPDEENTMSDEFDEGIGGTEQEEASFEAPEESIEAAEREPMPGELDEGIGGTEQEEASFEAPEESVEAAEREPMTAEEQSFRNVLHQRKQISESLKNGSLPCLPGTDGYADTSPAVNLVNGTRYHGANLLYLKDFQKRNGFPTCEYATQEAIQKSGIPIRKGEHGVSITFDQKNEAGQWEKKNVKLFNVAQTSRPWDFRKYAEGLAAEKEQQHQEYLKTQFGANYQPPEKKERAPGPEIACSSTEPERYLAQYLAAVSLGGKFKVTPQQAGEFAEKMQGQLYEHDLGKEVSNPFKLSKICNAANVQCREVIKEQLHPQFKHEPEQKHSRRL
jgi:hypothetical protein